MRIIDFRLRPPLLGYLDTIMYSKAERRDAATRRHGMKPAASAVAQSIELLLEEMAKGGVSCGIMTGRTSRPRYGSVSNEDLARIANDHPGRFVGVPSIDPSNRHPAIREIEKSHKAGLVGVNIEPGTYDEPMKADDGRLYPIYAYCEDNAIPVIIMAGGSAGPDLSYTNPEHIDKVARDFPNMKVAVTHGGWPWVTEILHIAYRRPNLYVSPDQYLRDMPGMSDYLVAARGYLRERFIYGSSYPFLPVDDCAAWFRSLSFDEATLARLMELNAREFLGLAADMP